MNNRRRFRLFLICLSLILAWTTNSCAGGIGKIGDPIILSGVKHKILVLEFDNPLNTTWGKEISQIIAQEILGTMTGVRSLGVVHLHQPETERVEYTLEKIKEIADTQRALIVIWGEFYTDEENVYLYSHLRVIPSVEFRESWLGLTLEIWDRNYVVIDTIKALPPTLQVNFKPIKLSIKTLEELHTFYNQTIIVRSNSNEDSQEVGQLKPGDTYTVNKREGDWSEIVLQSKLKGWIKHSTLTYQKELEEVKSVLKLAQGTLQYIAGEYEVAARSLREYLDTYGKDQDDMNKAFSHILFGTAKLREENYIGDVLVAETVSAEYEIADSVLRGNASSVNHLVIINLLKYFNQPTESENYLKLEQRLINIIKTENDLQTIKNLRILYISSLIYRFLWDGSTSEAEYQELLERRIQLLNEMEFKLSQK